MIDLIYTLLLYRFQLAAASFLQTPRINFVGQFRVDVATNNNVRLNYLFSSATNQGLNELWNPNGTNTWAMINCVVTSVALTELDGRTKILTTAKDDDIIGLPIVNNPESAFPKLVDVDPDQQQSSTIYGMNLGVNWDPNNVETTNAFIGDFVPSVITRDIWPRQVKSEEPLQQIVASDTVSHIKNVKWSNSITSNVLNRFKGADKLSVMFTVYNFTRPPTADLFSYGNVVGSIGIAETGESLSFPENRMMVFRSKNPPMEIPKENPCADVGDWMSTTYFDVVGKKMTINFANSLPINVQGTICHLFRFYVGVITESTSTLATNSDVEIIGEIPYMEENWYLLTAGIQDFYLTDSQQQLLSTQHRVVIVTSPDVIVEGSKYPICSSEHSDAAVRDDCVYTILEETPCLVRPMDYYVYRMEEGNTITVPMKVKHYGVSPTNPTSVTLFDKSPNGPAASGNQMVYESTVKTNPEDGIAYFKFEAGDVGNPRGDIHLDGQLFTFGYCSEECISECDRCVPTNIGNQLVFLIWSPVKYSTPYFWDTDIQPIFTQYQNLYPIMSDILKLGDYDDVTKPWNIHMLIYSMSLDIYHPSYMPATRDLSPTKLKMILDWLNTTEHHRNWQDVDNRLYESPKFCEQVVFAYDDKEKSKAEYVSESLLVNSDEDDDDAADILTLASSEIARLFSDISRRSVSESLNDFSSSLPRWSTVDCSVDILKENLQTAIALEFSTIPPYMTALYSIKDGYNREVYDTIRSVVMQEMLHLAQAANLLIAIGGQPLIDDPSVIPQSFPSNLPGGVLPGLTVTLQKASPKHVADVFMIIEFPDDVIYKGPFHDETIDLNVLTIGAFYSTIQKCMVQLDREGKINFGNLNKQLHWPWKIHDVGSKLWKVSNIKEAKKAIQMIIEQGEGSTQEDPTYQGTQQLAHFFKFEQLACKHHIQSTPEHSYKFKGAEIEFVSEGVWPMRDNPSPNGLPVGSHVYREAKIFHRIYRSMLRSLQTTFNGSPDSITEAVTIMEAMQLQAKKLMQIQVPVPDGHPNQTCGPVFNYNWPTAEPLNN